MEPVQEKEDISNRKKTAFLILKKQRKELGHIE